jgi:two-component sensor histidine kinase
MRSMGVLYDKLYRSENLREMSVKNFLPPLVDDIVGNFPNSAAVKIEKYIDDFVLDVKVLSPLGIITNELITNAMKYAFIGRDDGVITVAASTKDNRMTLTVQDNGNGIPDSVDIESSTGFGLKLVGILAKQLHGTVRIESGNGTSIILEFGVCCTV